MKRWTEADRMLCCLVAWVLFGIAMMLVKPAHVHVPQQGVVGEMPQGRKMP